MSRIISITGYIAVGIFAIVLVWYAWRVPERLASFGTLLDRVMTSRALRITLILFWWWIGWHFFAAAPLPASS
ncbi:hypothetical protein GCM10028798_26070 [Humibacter antri]